MKAIESQRQGRQRSDSIERGTRRTLLISNDGNLAAADLTVNLADGDGSKFGDRSGRALGLLVPLLRLHKYRHLPSDSVGRAHRQLETLLGGKQRKDQPSVVH